MRVVREGGVRAVREWRWEHPHLTVDPRNLTGPCSSSNNKSSWNPYKCSQFSQIVGLIRHSCVGM